MLTINHLFARTRAIALGLTLLTAVGTVSWRLYQRYGSESLAQLPITTAPEQKSNLVGRSITFASHTNTATTEQQYTINIMLQQGDQRVPVELKNIDLGLLLPQVPEPFQAVSSLSQWFLTEREFNRQRVMFTPGSEHLVLPESIDGYDAEQIKLRLR